MLSLRALRIRLAVRCGRGRVRHFLAEPNASVLPIVALCTLMLLGAVGLAVDATRLMMMHAKLQSAIDAAGLSAAARYSTKDVSAQATKFAGANFLDASIGATLGEVTATPSADEQIITIKATASAPTTFMKLFGIDTLSTGAASEITRAGEGGIELSLVLDVTGSMADDNKIGSLKTAANTLLDVLYGDKTTDDLLHIGIVPFSESVNIGTGHTAWMKSTTSAWKGCAEARFSGYDLKDDAPTSTKTDTLFDPADKSGLNCPPIVTPLTSTKSTLSNAISKLSPAGATHIAHGAAWGWYMLSPKWRGQWGGTMGTTLPLDSGTKGMTKAMIIMTDGDNTYNIDTSYGPLYCAAYSGNTCTTYKTDSRLNVTAAANKFVDAAATVLDSKLATICTKIKDAGITVYTVSLGEVANDTKKLLEGCATQKAYYFPSPSGSELKTAFAQIGDSLSQLRVSR